MKIFKSIQIHISSRFTSAEEEPVCEQSVDCMKIDGQCQSKKAACNGWVIEKVCDGEECVCCIGKCS